MPPLHFSSESPWMDLFQQHCCVLGDVLEFWNIYLGMFLSFLVHADRTSEYTIFTG